MKVYIHNYEAISGIGSSWNDIWGRLIECQPDKHTYSPDGTYIHSNPITSRLASVNSNLNLKDGLLYGRATRLAIKCAAQTLKSYPLDEEIQFYGGSTHNEADIMMLHNSKVEPEKGNNISNELLRENLVFETIPRALVNQLERPINIFAWIHSSCVSALHALIIAATNNRLGANSIHFVLGVDAINDIEVAGFNKVGGITKSHCQPFNTNRDGILIGEGAAGLILSQNQPSDISITGMGMGCDADDATAPSGNGLKRAISAALKQAGLKGKDIGAIVLHGTGTKLNDEIEAKIIQKITNKIPIPCTSVKGILGHTMGAAGLFNVLVGATALKKGILPPTLFVNGEIISNLDLVTHTPRLINSSKPLLVLASGFGGNNVAIILNYEGN